VLANDSHSVTIASRFVIMNFAKRMAFLLLKEISSALGVFATSLLTPLVMLMLLEVLTGG
jgi:hypothetical protein